MIHGFVRIMLITLARAALTLGASPPIAHAVDQVVTNCSNDTELRADLTTLQSGGGMLTFDCGTATIVLGAQLPDINTNITIDGDGRITVSGVSAVRLFRISGLGTLTLKRMVLERGYGGSSNGGAIVNDGRLTLDDTTILSRHALDMASLTMSSIRSQLPRCSQAFLPSSIHGREAGVARGTG